ncbi:MAG: glycosyltransferase family 2 protein [bacterium]|nr:glycosyltransferase family 2 protein [bacterium]
MAVIIFWVSLALLAYVYAGYPLLARLLGAVVNRRVNAAVPGEHLPTVTVLIAAFNEAAHIEATVRNKLESDYPADLLDVVVVSDESEDGTDAIVNGIGDPRVRLLRQEPRAGKTSALNLAMPEVTSEVVVFSDANSLYRPDTIGHLVAALADPDVGYVTGRMVYKAPDGSLTGEGCSAYMVYENKLREYETRLGSIVGVDGGVDALRRRLWTPMNADQLPDFVEPLSVREGGHRVVYEPRALLYEDALAASGDEWRMRVRVGLRAFHALKDKAALLNPFRFGLFAWQLWSHKVLRYLAFVFMAGAFGANAYQSWVEGSYWSLLFTGQVVFYLTAGFGHLMSRREQELPKAIGLAYYLCVLNLASAVAFWRFLKGEKQVTWKPRT